MAGTRPRRRLRGTPAGTHYGMDPRLTFLFYLGAVVCFVIAAFSAAVPGPGATGRGLGARVGLVPLGLALWLFPAMWATGSAAF